MHSNASNLQVLFEDNHLIVVNKRAGDIVQGDKTGDKSLAEHVKTYIKDNYNKPGNVYLGIVHRLDRPTSGIVIYARTSKAAARMSELFRDKNIEKTYWAVVEKAPEQPSGKLTHWLKKNPKQNKSYAVTKEQPEYKKAVLSYQTLAQGDRYALVSVRIETGRHHQIRCQLSTIGSIIKGDLKYGAKRSNRDGSISLHARSVTFAHPVTKEEITITAPVPEDNLWQSLATIADEKVQ
ncbi:MAG: RNA pseudouridine synthase [Crocinitomicaceae bacterium]|nr:RNA pseudouridine synthase [Crocinitomicaceae bacterium]|tara:strand:- start:1388 stop:2098 length:711 start_codon:yes stop_codon:yes gene_type:complete